MQTIVGDPARDSDADEKLHMIEAEVSRLAGLVAQLTARNGVNPERMTEIAGIQHPAWSRPALQPPPVSFDRARAHMVRSIIRHRRMRERQFPAHLLADPGWDMLLDLYAAHYEGQKVSVSSLCIASAVPATTALRWIKTLSEEGHLERSQDPYDGRRVYLAISAPARAKMDEYFDDIEG